MTEIERARYVAREINGTGEPWAVIDTQAKHGDEIALGFLTTKAVAEKCATALSAQASRVVELEAALEKIGSQAICYGMTADESELRDWLKNISDIAESAIGREDGNQS